MHRAFHCFHFRAVPDVPVFKCFNFVLGQLHLLTLISKVPHLARSISWQAIDTLSALASTARISQMRERCRPRKVLLWRPAHQSAPTYRLKAVIAPRATPRDAVDFLVICQRRMLSQRSRREQGTAGRV